MAPGITPADPHVGAVYHLDFDGGEDCRIVVTDDEIRAR